MMCIYSNIFFRVCGGAETLNAASIYFKNEIEEKKPKDLLRSKPCCDTCHPEQAE